jgi:hypothetical protein
VLRHRADFIEVEVMKEKELLGGHTDGDLLRQNFSMEDANMEVIGAVIITTKDIPVI